MRVSMLAIGLICASTLIPCAARAQEPAPLVPEINEPAEDQTYPPAAGLQDALDRARAALRAVEEQGVEARDRVPEAQFYLDQAERLDPLSLKAEYLRGRLSVLMGQPRRAFNQIRAYVFKDPEGSVDWEAHKILGDLHYAGSYYIQAESRYRRAAQLAPAEPDVYLGLAKALLKQAKRDDAIDAARKAAELEPKEAEAFEIMAEAFLEKQDLNRAKVAILAARERARAELREDPSSLRLIARLQADQSKLQEILQGQVERNPNEGALYVEIAEVVIDSAELSRLMVLHQVFFSLKLGVEQSAPQAPPELIDRFVDVARTVGKVQEAAEVLEDYIADHPSDSAAADALARLTSSSQPEAEVPAVPEP